MPAFRTWIRVKDATGEFDWPKDQPLRPGVTAVPDAPEYRGPVARASKPFTDKAGNPTLRTSYDTHTVPELQAIISARIDNGHDVDPASDRKADLIAALLDDDNASGPNTDGPDHGDNPDHETGAAGEGDE